MSRLRRLKDDKGATNLYDRQYSYNPANNISQIVEPSGTKNYGYDNLDRLTGVTGASTESYAYDVVGNRTTSHLSANYTYQPNNRMASTATASFLYDNNGNMSSKTDASGVTQYTWDYEDRLRTVTKPGNLTVNYKYDALGRRSEQIYGNGFGTKFTYDKYDVILDTNSDLTTVKYVNGLGIDDKLKMIAGTTVSYFVQDHQGSTVALTNPAGAITSSATYDAYGNSSGNLATRYAYTGREYDSFTGLHYYRARYYDSNLGRFLTEDPIGLAGGINPFAYVGNNPRNFSDPMGLDSEWDQQVWQAQQDLIGALEPAINFGAGFGDQILWGVSKYLRPDVGIDECSKAYKAGEWTAFAVELAMGGAGIVKAGVKYFAKKVGKEIFEEGLEQGVKGAAQGGAKELAETGAKEGIENVISGFTKHGINQAISRDGVGVATKAILDAVKNPIKTVIGRGGATKYVGENATVVVSEAGKVITTWGGLQLKSVNNSIFIFSKLSHPMRLSLEELLQDQPLYSDMSFVFVRGQANVG